MVNVIDDTTKCERSAGGELRKLATGWEARVTLQKRDRVGLFLAAFPLHDEAGARARCTELAIVASRLRRGGHTAEMLQLLEMGAKAKPGKPWEAVLAAVNALCAGETEDSHAKRAPTFKEFAAEWCDGTLAKKFPHHVKKKRSADRDE